MARETFACRSRVAITGTSGPTTARRRASSTPSGSTFGRRCRRAVQGKEDAVHRHGGAQPVLEPGEKIVEDVLLDRA
jgi:hypothetical protein